jgi:hypothetical protein
MNADMSASALAVVALQARVRAAQKRVRAVGADTAYSESVLLRAASDAQRSLETLLAPAALRARRRRDVWLLVNNGIRDTFSYASRASFALTYVGPPLLCAFLIEWVRVAIEPALEWLYDPVLKTFEDLVATFMDIFNTLTMGHLKDAGVLLCDVISLAIDVVETIFHIFCCLWGCSDCFKIELYQCPAFVELLVDPTVTLGWLDELFAAVLVKNELSIAGWFAFLLRLFTGAHVCAAIGDEDDDAIGRVLTRWLLKATVGWLAYDDCASPPDVFDFFRWIVSALRPLIFMGALFFLMLAFDTYWDNWVRVLFDLARALVLSAMQLPYRYLVLPLQHVRVRVAMQRRVKASVARAATAADTAPVPLSAIVVVPAAAGDAHRRHNRRRRHGHRQGHRQGHR